MSLATSAFAVKPAAFIHTTEADFADGDAQAAVVTNLGDIKLASETVPIDNLPEGVDVIHDSAVVDGVIYLATGPEAKLLKLADDGIETVAEYEGEQVFTLFAAGKQLLIGVSSASGARIESLGSDGPQTLATLENTNFIWDMLLAPGQTDHFILATGTPGKVIHVKTDEGDDGISVLLETKQSNILSLAVDTRGNIYAGTDTDGLIYRIDPAGVPFVVYDAPEAEVAALVAMPDGTLYAGTAAADQAKPGQMTQPVKAEEGRNDQPASELDIENRPPDPEELGQDAVDQPAQPDVADDDAAAATDADDEADTAQPDEQAEAEVGKPAAPQPEQYDALREELRQRLQEARESGSLTGDGPAAVAAAPSTARSSRAKPAAPPQRKNGNAVYQITPDGFVTEVFRESAMILAIVPHDGKLILATGNEGQVYQVDPALQETTVLADLDSAQITSATPTDSGLLLGGANPGALVRMSTDVADQGTYTSRVLDAGQISLFGMFKLTAEIPSGTAIAVQLRSGNVGDPEQAAWSAWSEPVKLTPDDDANPLAPRELSVPATPARYLQYRLILDSHDNASPVIDQVEIAYVAPNTPPVVAKMIVKPAPVNAPGEDPDPKVTIQWQATDDNEDRLLYSVEYRPGKAERYLPLAEGLTAPKYEWQTQHVPDGWYTVRVTAYDKLDNPPDSAKSGSRISEPLLIDNTQPTLENLRAQVLGDGQVKLTAKVTDELSPISSVAYSVNGSETYQATLPDDLIYDSTSEAWGVTISDLSPGAHVIAVRAIDAKGNTAYRQLIVDVK